MVCFLFIIDTPANGQPTIGKPFYVQAKGQLRLTCAFYAECAHEGSGAFGARVQRVQKVQRVEVDGASPRGLWPPDGGRLCSLRSGGDSACGAEGGGLPYRAMLIKSALRDLLFCVIGHDKHSADWLAALASPFPASPDFPLFRGQNRFLCFPAETWPHG